MVDLNSTIAIIALNLNGLNTAIKKILPHWIGKNKRTQLDAVYKKCTLNQIV